MVTADLHLVVRYVCAPYPYLCVSEAIAAPPAHKHEVGYVTSHKGPALVATFSHDGEGREGGGEGGRVS